MENRPEAAMVNVLQTGRGREHSSPAATSAELCTVHGRCGLSTRSPPRARAGSGSSRHAAQQVWGAAELRAVVSALPCGLRDLAPVISPL